jgi:hypothetical protein
MLANVPAQDFGQALQRCRGAVTRDALATCLFSSPLFTVPSTVADASSLASYLANIEAGQAWPFDRTDFLPFMNAVADCLPHCSVAAYYNLRFCGGLYYPTL